jgi:hypothetical protein
MALAGELAVAPLHAKNVNTSTTAGFTTTETLTDTITVNLVTGKEYEIVYSGMMASTVATDNINPRLREDSTAGTSLDGIQVYQGAANILNRVYMRARYTAVATGAKTFIVSGQRGGGTGTITRIGASANPSLLTVDQVL